MPWPDRATEQELLWRCQRLLERWQEGELSPDEALDDIGHLCSTVRQEVIGDDQDPEVQT